MSPRKTMAIVFLAGGLAQLYTHLNLPVEDLFQ